MGKRKLKVSVFEAAAIFAAFSSLASTAQAAETSPSTVTCERAIVSARDTLTTIYHENDASILIQVGDRVLVSKSFGAGVTEDSRFLLGSVTKTLHATVAARLLARGTLSLEDSVVPLLPADLASHLPASWSVLKVRNLMHHTSGIEDYLNRDNDTQQAETDRFLKTDHDLSSLVEFLPLALEFKPDTGYRYSNTNYLLLGHILSEKSGLEDHALINQELVDPLSLQNTGTIESSWDSAIRGTSGIDPSDLIGVGNAYSSARDLMTVLRALDGNSLVPEAWVKKMYLPDPDCHGSNCWEYGLGFSLRPSAIDGHDWVYHEGKLDTVSALVAKVPGLKLNMTVVSDKIQYDNATLASELFTRLIQGGCMSASLPDELPDTVPGDPGNSDDGVIVPTTTNQLPTPKPKPTHTKPIPAPVVPPIAPAPVQTPAPVAQPSIDPSDIGVITEQ